MGMEAGIRTIIIKTMLWLIRFYDLIFFANSDECFLCIKSCFTMSSYTFRYPKENDGKRIIMQNSLSGVVTFEEEVHLN